MNSQRPLRIAMWSGPRNISTALMRSWGNRPDTYVCDEPLYAHYLLHTESKHPGAADVIAHHETNWRKVVSWLTGDIPQGKAIFYQKHMAHHLLPHIERSWLSRLANCLLIREPREMLASLIQFLPRPKLTDTGLPQQVEIFGWVEKQTGKVPAVVDARDILENPRSLLQLLCEKLDVNFVESMLSWPAGRRDTDGVWAKYWYLAVDKSTSFQPYVSKRKSLPKKFHRLNEECLELYRSLYDHRLHV